MGLPKPTFPINKRYFVGNNHGACAKFGSLGSFGLICIASIIAAIAGGCFPCKNCYRTECDISWTNTTQNGLDVCNVTYSALIYQTVHTDSTIRKLSECHDFSEKEQCFLHRDPSTFFNRNGDSDDPEIFLGTTEKNLEKRCPILFWTYIISVIMLITAILYDFIVIDFIIFAIYCIVYYPTYYVWTIMVTCNAWRKERKEREEAERKEREEREAVRLEAAAKKHVGEEDECEGEYCIPMQGHYPTVPNYPPPTYQPTTPSAPSRY